MTAPPREWTRLQKFVWTLRAHGNEPENLSLESLAKHNPWSVDELLEEFKIQQNGSRRLPEEVAAAAPSSITQEDEEE